MFTINSCLANSSKPQQTAETAGVIASSTSSSIFTPASSTASSTGSSFSAMA